jgi:hypothetical protein
MGKIIKFPRRNDRVEGVKYGFNSLSFQNYAFIGLAAVFIFALILNISFQGKNNQTRELANYNTIADNAKLDDYILQSLNTSDASTEIVFSKKPDQEDKFIFETLLGSYDVIKTNGKISSMVLKPGYNPLSSSMLPKILTQYRRALDIGQMDFKLKENQIVDKTLFTYDLISSGKSIGAMTVGINEAGEILSIQSRFKSN